MERKLTDMEKAVIKDALVIIRKLSINAIYSSDLLTELKEVAE